MSLPFNLSDIEHLESNLAWQEIMRTIDERLSMLQADIRRRNPMNPEQGHELAQKQGQMNELDWFKGQIEVMKAEVEEFFARTIREEEKEDGTRNDE